MMSTVSLAFSRQLFIWSYMIYTTVKHLIQLSCISISPLKQVEWGNPKCRQVGSSFVYRLVCPDIQIISLYIFISMNITGCKDFTEESQRKTEHDDEGNPQTQNPDPTSHPAQNSAKTEPSGKQGETTNQQVNFNEERGNVCV